MSTESQPKTKPDGTQEQEPRVKKGKEKDRFSKKQKLTLQLPCRAGHCRRAELGIELLIETGPLGASTTTHSRTRPFITHLAV